MAGKSKYLLNRDGRYFARIVIPADLREFLDNKTELRTPLGPDRRSAQARLELAVADMKRELAVAERRAKAASGEAITPGRYPLTPDEIAIRDYNSRIAFDIELRNSGPAWANIGIDDLRVQLLRDGLAGRLNDDTGARVNEITVLEKADIFELEGHWFIHIRVGDGRDTKTHKERKVPIHRALISEGFLEWVAEQGEGRLFPGGKNEDQRIREWIKEKVFPNRTDMPPPNHGFRHLFEDALFAGISQKAALYITGRASGSSADEYGGSELRLLEIASQMGKIRNIIE